MKMKKMKRHTGLRKVMLMLTFLFICVSYAWCQQLKKVSGKELRYQTAFQLTSENGFQMLVSKMEFR